jgi:hypothetical protein
MDGLSSLSLTFHVLAAQVLLCSSAFVIRQFLCEWGMTIGVIGVAGYESIGFQVINVMTSFLSMRANSAVLTASSNLAATV